MVLAVFIKSPNLEFSFVETTKMSAEMFLLICLQKIVQSTKWIVTSVNYVLDYLVNNTIFFLPIFIKI